MPITSLSPLRATVPALAIACLVCPASSWGAPPTTPSPAPTQPPRMSPSPAEQLEAQNRKFQALESFSRALNLLEGMYVDEKVVGSDALIEKALKGMVSQLDPHTVYLPAAQLRELANDTSGKFGGIGVILSQANSRLEIVEVVPDSPAARAGLQAGDQIQAVDGIVVTPSNIDEVLAKMRGLPGSALKLVVVPVGEGADKPTVAEKPDTHPRSEPSPRGDLHTPNKGTTTLARKPVKTRSVTLTREIIHTSSVTHAPLANGYAYIRVSVFQEDTGEQVDKALRAYQAKNGGKLDGLILDLRNNPGGLLDQAVRVVDLFLDSGVIVSTVGRDRAKQDVEYATKRNTHPYMPLVVMVNEGSASASEIVAGALQDHNRALVVGSVTFGKGSVQSIVPLPNGAGLKMTIARYYTPKGRSIQARGIQPDIPLPPLSRPQGIPRVAGEASRSGTDDEKTAFKKESDLEGHIEASDLVQAQPDGFNADIEKWMTGLKSDNQLKIAYTYVRSWSRFNKPTLPSP